MHLFPKPKRGPRGLYPSTSELAGLPLCTVGVCVLGVFLWNLAGQGPVSKVQAAELGDGVAFAARAVGLKSERWRGKGDIKSDTDPMPQKRMDASTARRGRADAQLETGGSRGGATGAVNLGRDAMVALGPGATGEAAGGGILLLSRGMDQDGKRVGIWETFEPGGQPRSKGRYEDGRRAGHWQFWSESGTRDLTGEYRDGMKHGAWSGWHPNGSRRSDQAYSEGRPNGTHTLWYSNGQVKETGLFVLGLRQGLWQFYDFAGNPDMRTGIYVNGQRVTDGS